MTNYYYDYLVDCILLIGANEVSGLMPPQQQVVHDEKPEQYQQQIIAALSATVALFPCSSTSYTYPPEDFCKYDETAAPKPLKRKLKRVISECELQTIHDLVTQFNKVELKGVSGVSGINRRDSRYRSKRRSIREIKFDAYNGSWGAVSTDTIKSFPAIYFRNNLQLSTDYKIPQVQFLPLTDNMGNRSFAIRMEFYRKFSITSGNNCKNSGTVNIEVVTKEAGDCPNIVYVPSNIVLFSKYPYFDLFREILSRLFKRIDNADTQTIEHELMTYSSILTRIPVLKSATMTVSFAIHDAIFSIEPTIPFYHEIIDWDMTILFQVLSLESIVSILLAMFQEKQIVFLADDTNLITVVTETLFLLFRPFQWKHFYLTTTPVHLYELVDAIFPFMVGLPHHMKHDIIKYYPDIIIVDLEGGDIIIPKSCQLKYVSQHLTEQLTKQVRQSDWVKSSKSISFLTQFSYQESRKYENNINKQFSVKVLTSFMIFMVDLFHDVIGNIAIEKREGEMILANLDKFLMNISNPNVEFFNEIRRTDGFSCFIDEKLNKKTNDGWMRIYKKRYPDLVKQSKFSRATGDSRLKTVDVDFITLLENENETQREILFPTSMKLGSNYYQTLLDNINELENTLNIKKLRAEIFLQSGNPIKALEEFYTILLENHLDLSYSKLRKIIRGIGEDNLKKLKLQDFHFSFFQMIKFDERRVTLPENLKPYIEQFNPPSVPISKNSFLDCCRNANISEYEEAMNTLFYCLTLDTKSKDNRVKTVHPGIFKCFYHNWINSSPDLSDVDMSWGLSDEILIKCTESCVRVDGNGLGRVILTQYRLFFIPFSKSCCDIIINFKDGSLLKVKIDRRIKGFGKVAEVLELVMRDKESKIIWLSNDTNTWYQLISEMSMCHQLAELEKDKEIVNVATDQCLMYENLVNCAKKNAFFKANLNEMRKKLLPNSSKKYVSNKYKSEEHRKYLIDKLMPSPKQPVTIDCALEIYNPHSKITDIWCACESRGKYFVSVLPLLGINECAEPVISISTPIRILTMIHISKTKNVVACGTSHLVMLLDIESHYKETEFPLPLEKGSYPLCGTSSIDDNCLIYFGTNQGEILCWNYKTDETNVVTKLVNGDPINSLNLCSVHTLVVGSLYSFHIMTTNGQILCSVAISELLNIMTKISCIIAVINNSKLITCLDRLPVFIEYDLGNVNNVVCVRRRNLFTNKEFNISDIQESHELSPAFVGISSIMIIDGETNRRSMWIMFKDGTIDVRDYWTLARLMKFNAHVDMITRVMLCNIANQQMVVSVGRKDGKVALWALQLL